METSTTGSSLNGVRGFYAAEAGLNLRADQVRRIFVGYNRPAGTGPDPASSDAPCEGSNGGSGDLACAEYAFQGRRIRTYLEEMSGNPISVVIPRGELFQNLHAQEYRYETFASAFSGSDRLEASLEMRFRSRLVPMFQFAAFYNKDLEILPGPDMILGGPVHANGSLYLGCDGTMNMQGQVTTAERLFHGRKNQNICQAGPVRVIDPVNPRSIPACTGGRREVLESELVPWNDMIRIGTDPLTVPPPEDLDPTPGRTYWDKADLRVMLDVNGATPAIQVRRPDGTTDATATADLNACAAVTTSNTLFNNREATSIRMLDVDVRSLLDCVHNRLLMGVGKALDETSEGGLVFYLGVDGPSSAAINPYGVRVRNGAELRSDVAGAPAIRGLTVVTAQAVYIQGSYNSTNKKPAAFLADSLNVLSNNWTDARSTQALGNRAATDTTVQAAFLAGTDTTGGAEGSAGQDVGAYNGGLENYPRFHESWTGRTFTYRGSLVSLNRPRHVSGAWVYGSPQYNAPNRDWRYDNDFDHADRLPPLSPRFVYLRQEIFTRKFERS